MEFVHDPYQPGETIAAVATPPGEGGVAIVRISGDNALDVAARVFSGPVHQYHTHTFHYGQIRNQKNEVIDHVLLVVMHAPRSYTGETTVEIHCHGGSIITRRVLEAVLKAGARAARPGEFTFKAFMNGKLDLAQAEAVQELICAKNERALDAAERQLQGNLSRKIMDFQKSLTDIAAILEAWVDFPEEGLEFASIDETCATLETVSAEMEHLVNTFQDGRILHDGVSLCLVGCPNVGKSSLMNALLDKDRAIVSPQPGTTRDVVEDHIRLNGVHLRLLDTAGIRQASDTIEQEGIRRSQDAMKQADVVLLVLDSTRGINNEDESLLREIPKPKSIVVWNKIDLLQNGLPMIEVPHVVSVSAKYRSGIERLKAKIDEVIWTDGAPAREEIVITNVRHKESLSEAAVECKQLISCLRQGISPEFLSIHMRQCLHALGRIIGSNITEDILSAVFSKFCIGK